MARISHHPQSNPKVEDGFLITLAKLGDHNAHERLVRRYHGFVRLKASSYFLAAARRAGFWCYGAVAPDASSARPPVPYDRPDYAGAGVVLVLGSEGSGLRPRVAKACDELMTLPQCGRIGSLGVGAAAAALLYEILQSRRGALDKGR